MAEDKKALAYTLRTIERQIGGELAGNGDALISGINALEAACDGELTFAEDEKYAPKVRSTRASAVIVSKQFPAIADKNLLRVANPRLAFIKVMMMFQPRPSSPGAIHPTAVVSPQATLAPGVTVSECAVIRAGARIGTGTVIESGVHIGEGVSIGEGCYLGPNVVVTAAAQIGNRVIMHGGVVIGADGFGFVWAGDHHMKIPQLGTVIIEDDVELGANSCVDRATFGSTVVGRGTKVDNMVQIAHNDIIGEHVILAGQVGLAGSVTIKSRAMLGGKAGVIDHLTVGEGGRVGAAGIVTKDVKPGEVVWGFPARPLARVKRELASLAQLPRLLKRLRDRSA